MKKRRMSGKWFGMGMIVVTMILFGSLHSSYAAEPIPLCSMSDFSSVGAVFGIQEVPVIEMVVKEVNAAGGINGRPIKLTIQDAASDPSKAIGIARMFKEQYKCKVIIGPVISSVGLALKAWGEKNQISVMAIDPATDRIWDKSGKSWIFRTEVPGQIRLIAGLARMKKLGYTKVAFEGSTLAWGTDSLNVLKEKAPEYGMTVVGAVQVEPKTKDLTIQAKQLMDTGAQAVICADYEAEAGVFARAMKSIGWKPYVFHVSSATYTNTLATNPPELFEGWETSMTIDATKPIIKEIWNKTSAFTGKAMIQDEKAPRVWDAINLLLAAMKAGGNPDDSVAIRDGYYKLKNYERAIGKKGSKGGYVEGKNHLLDIDDLVPYTTVAGKLVPAK